MSRPAAPLSATERDDVHIARLWVAIQEYERQRASSGKLPDRRKLLINRARWIFELAGGVMLALNIAMVTLLMNFVIFNLLLHATFD